MAIRAETKKAAVSLIIHILIVLAYLPVLYQKIFKAHTFIYPETIASESGEKWTKRVRLK